jgi:hypothetical protein
MYAILEDLNANVEGIKSKLIETCISLVFSTLLFLVNIIKQCDAKLFEIVLKVFSKYTNLHNSRISHVVNNYYFEDETLDIFNQLVFLRCQ